MIDIEGLYEMKLHDSVEISENTVVTKVVGGWKYTTATAITSCTGQILEMSSSSVFVPIPTGACVSGYKRRPYKITVK